jgi:hypothetical protein
VNKPQVPTLHLLPPPKTNIPHANSLTTTKNTKKQKPITKKQTKKQPKSEKYKNPQPPKKQKTQRIELKNKQP